MEELRKQLTASSDLFAVKGGKPRRFVKRSSTPSADTVITISSTESSPSRVSSHVVEEASARSSNTSSIADSDDDSYYSEPGVPFKVAKSEVKRLVWTDDEDEQITPTNPPAQVKAEQAAYGKPFADMKAADSVPNRPKPEIISLDSDNEDVTTLPVPKAEPKPPFKRVPTVIKPPTVPPPDLPLERDDEPLWETFDQPDVEHLYDPKKTAAEAEHDLQELLSSSMNDAAVEIDMRDAIVDGFQEGIKLLPHQVIGRKWMAERESGKKAGGILADDMGLGKTIQTLTRIVDGRPRKSDKNAGYAASTLVVCPVALVSQWVTEIQKMAVGLRVIEHHGPSRTTNPESLKRAHIVITSYSVLSSEHGTYEQSRTASKPKAKSRPRNASLSEESDTSDDFIAAAKKVVGKSKKVMDALFHVKWWRIVLDEAHNIKNRNTKAAKACCALEGKFRWALTGTPMQNNVEELYSLLKFLRIRPLNDWEVFNQQINKPVKSGKSVRAMRKLQVVLKAVMLRRKKDSMLNGKLLLELPDRNVEIVPCEFDADERDFYESIASKVETALNKFRQSGEISKNYTSVLVLLLRLRQACNHPSLLSKEFALDKEAVDPQAARDGKDLEDADDLANLFGQMGVSSSKCQMCQQSLSGTQYTSNSQYCSDCESIACKSRRKSLASGSNTLPPDSAKIRMILRILRRIRDSSMGEKTIIFSQFTSMLDLIQPFLRDEAFKFVRYDGSMRKDQREESLRRIRKDRSTTIILISFKAGGTGLNLTACNNVILVDLWWNPALEDQAFDRAHRFGQTRAVNIYKLTIEGTVEERILALQEKKRALAAAALSGDKIKNSRLNLDELMALFKPGGHDREDEDED